MSVKTLLVDDEIRLIEQAEIFLERGDEEIEVLTATSAEKALEMIDDRDFDVIVSDYQMPEKDGIEFLKEVREVKNCDLPFIMFTGKGREKVAIKALNLGADRYLQKKGTPKSQYGILADSISQEHKYHITEKERERYTSELEFLNDVILNVNKMQSTDEICEYIADRVHSLNDEDYVTVSLYNQEEEIIQIRALKGFDDHPELVERLIHSDDKPIFDPDIQDEWSDIYSSGKLELMPQGVYSLVKGVLSKEEAEEIEELLGIKKVYSVGFAVDNKPYGSLSIYKTSGEDVKFSSAIETIANHISEILQRRQSEDELRKSREEIKKGKRKYKSLFNSIRDAILVADTDRNIINCNQAFTDIFGYELDEIKGKKTKYVYHDEKQFEEMGDEIREKMGERDFYYTVDYEKKSGEVFPGETNVFYLRDDENKISGFIGIIRDVTEQQKSKEKLKESEEKYRRLFEGSQDGILIVDAETGVIKDSNPHLQEILGYSKEELFGKKVWKLSTFKNVTENKKKFKELVEKGYIRYDEITIKTKDGEEVPVEFVSNSYQAGGKKVVQCNIRKISERTKIKGKLENKDRQLKTLFDNVPGMAYRCLNNENWTMKFLSDGCEELTGFNQKDLIDDNKLAFSDMIKPEDKESIKNQIQNALDKEKSYQITYRIETAEGETKWVWARGRGIYDEDGDVKFLEGFIQDITERKENQQKLKQKERYLDHTPSFINVIDEEGEIKYLSYPPNEIKGLDPSDIVGSEGFKFVHPDDREEAEKIFSKCLEDPGKEYKTELRGETKDGWTWLEVRAVNYLDDPEINGIIVNTLDINQRKRVEKKLRESKNRLDLAIEGAELGVWDWNVKTDKVQFDEKWVEMLGYNLDEIEKNRDCWEKRVHPDDISRVNDKLEKHLRGETELFKIEHRMKTKSGDWIWIKSVGKVIERDEGDNPVRAVGIHEDITERKLAEEEIKYRENLERIITEVSTSLMNVQVEEIDEKINQALKKIGEFADADRSYIFQFSEDSEKMDMTHEWCAEGFESQKENMQNFSTDDLPWLMKKVKKFENITVPKVSNLPPEAEAFQNLLENQNIKSLLVLPLISDNELQCLIGFDWVKQEKKWSEEVVNLLKIAGETIQSSLDRKEIEKRYQSLVESQNDLIMRIDTDFRLTFVNDAYCDLFRKSREELLGDKFTPMIHEDDVEDTLEVMEKLKEHPYRTTMEQRVITDDGLRWIHWEYTAIMNEMDKIEVIQGVGREITERKKAEKRIEQNKRKTERLHKVSAELETCQCEEEVFRLAKSATEDILDFDICSFSKVEDDKIIMKERTSGLPEDDYLERPVEEGGIDTKTYLNQESYLIKNINKNEDAKPVKSKYKSALSIPIGKYGIFQAVDTEVDHFDGEDLKMAELLISHVTEALKRLETEEKEEFLHSLLRHDVANKNRVIKGYLEMINDHDLPDEVKELMENAEQTAEANKNLIEKVRKLRKIKEEDEISKVDMSPMLDKVLSNCKNQLQEKDITIDGGEFEEKVKGGPLLEELFSNLIENSIQHSDCDEIQISCKYKEDECIVAIEDDGIGIPNEVKENMFKKGFKGQESRGTGLGLYIVKEIAETYCGSVDVRDSDLGGVKFEIHLKEAQ